MLAAAPPNLLEWGSHLTSSNVPQPIADLTGVVSVSAGTSHILAMKSDGTVLAWGDNQTGELGNGSDVYSSPVPVAVSNLTSVKAVAAGGAHSLALKQDGTVWDREIITITNDGTTPLRISGTSLLGLNPGDFKRPPTSVRPQALLPAPPAKSPSASRR